MKLTDGSRVAVVGGGPAGSFASYFLRELASRVDLDIGVDIYEPKDFSVVGPTGCNNCGGIVSESLVQMLAAEGINLPPTVVQRSIDSYVLHTDVGSVAIRDAGSERRIAAVHRGGGARGASTLRWDSFDGYLLDLARSKGAHVLAARVDDITWDGDRPRVHVKGEARTYDLLVGGVGINSTLLKRFERLGFGYRAPKTAKTYVSEYHLGLRDVTQYVGSSMHVFLHHVPRLEFAALIPKGEHVTLCVLGKDIDHELVERLLERPEVRTCFPPRWHRAAPACHCAPRINVGAARNPFADRIVLVGDSAVTRLYKDGIGAAYRTGKASALTAVFTGIAARDFRAHYWPVCRRLEADNRFGRVVFGIVGAIRRLPPLRRAVLEMVRREQLGAGENKIMSSLLWDTFTGSATYKDIFLRGLNVGLLTGLTLESARTISIRRPRHAW
jgi:flavin-dependent dehydrogenase